MTKTKKWVTIAIKGDHSLALEEEKKLRRAGVPVRLLDDVNEPHTVAFHWAPRAVLGGTAVQVDHRAVEEACEVLGILTPEEEALNDREERGADGGDAETDREARFALLLAVGGFVVCPGVAQLASLAACQRLWSLPLGARARRQVRLALLMNTAGIALFVAIALRAVPR